MILAWASPFKVELLTQFPTSNDKKYLFMKNIAYSKLNCLIILWSSINPFSRGGGATLVDRIWHLKSILAL